MNEIEAIKLIAERLETLSDEERDRVLLWVNAKYGSAAAHAALGGGAAPPPPTPPSPTPTSPATKGSSKSTGKPKTSKKAKSIIGMDKSLNLTPSGKPSATTFATQKAPSNNNQKAVVAVHYLRDTIGMAAVTVPAVFTFFKTVGWPVPTDLRNTLQKAGSEGWLDTADGDDIKLTSMGENLVEHSLPAKPKA